MEFVRLYDSPLGEIVLTGDDTALTGLWFRDRRPCPAGLEWGNTPVLRQTERWLDLYFGGEEPDFTPPLALRGTAFRRIVWELLLSELPYGRTVTYGELASRTAARLGRAAMSAQAVGGAVGQNPILLIVPCHRVIGADGSLIGYAGGLDRKRRLLELEARSLRPGGTEQRT